MTVHELKTCMISHSMLIYSRLNKTAGASARIQKRPIATQMGKEQDHETCTGIHL